MAAWPSPLDRLLAAPHQFGFHQAVRLLGRWRRTASSAGATPGQPAGDPADAGPSAVALRYRNGLALGFPASEIAQLATQRDADGRIERIEITPAFMGLLGATGALPAHYTELFAQREEAPHRDPSARAFLDIFQHRAVSLFHEAWRKHRLALQAEQHGDQCFLPLALSLAGLGQAPLRARLQAQRGGVSDHALAFHAGLLQQRQLGALALQRLLAGHFGLPVRVTQFVGRWFPLGEASRTLLGCANATLGGAALLGERVWQRDLRLRVTLGPLGRDALQRFLPGEPGALALRELLGLLTGASLEYEIRLRLRADEVRTVRLSGTPTADGARLGWDAFVQTRASPVDRSDAGYDIPAPTG